MTFPSVSISYPYVERTSWLKEILVVVGASFLISLFAQISIPLPFTPVPLTFQSHVILFLAVMLGSKRAAAATIGFLAQGAMGLPVFAGGKAGILCLAGPTGGYLVGYVIAAFLTGYLVEKMKDKTAAKVLLAMAAGNGVIFLFGMAWLSKFVGWPSAFMLGMAPFVAGDMIKLLLSTRTLKALKVIPS